MLELCYGDVDYWLPIILFISNDADIITIPTNNLSNTILGHLLQVKRSACANMPRFKCGLLICSVIIELLLPEHV